MYVVVLVLCCWHTIHQVFRSIGYKSVRVDKDIPFDHNKGIVLNEKGRIVSGEQHVTLRHPCMCACVSTVATCTTCYCDTYCHFFLLPCR